MTTRFFACALLAFAFLASCSPRYQSPQRGVAGPPDPSVAVFRSDVQDAWTSFRLGDGLNVVVVNPNLPREFAWSFGTGSEGISSSPVVYRTTVLVDSNDHYLYAIDAATGRVLWRYKAESQLMSQPVYQNGLVVIATGTGDCSVYFPPYYVTMDASINRIEAVDLTTGREDWSTGLGGTGMPTPIIAGRSLIHVDGAGTILAVDVRNGSYLWHAITPSIFSMTGLIDGHDGNVYAPGSFPDVIYAWNARDGALVWTHAFSPFYGGISDGPMASSRDRLVGMYLEPLAPGSEGMVVQAGSPSRQHVYALEKRTGRLVWNRTLQNARGIAPTRNESAIPLLYRNRVYIGSAVAPIVTALDLRNGRILWQVHVAGAVKGGMVARDGVVYFGDFAGYLWAVNAESGRVIGRKHEDLHFNVGSPIIVNDSLIDGSLEGTIVALPLRWIRDARD